MPPATVHLTDKANDDRGLPPSTHHTPPLIGPCMNHAMKWKPNGSYGACFFPVILGLPSLAPALCKKRREKKVPSEAGIMSGSAWDVFHFNS